MCLVTPWKERDIHFLEKKSIFHRRCQLHCKWLLFSSVGGLAVVGLFRRPSLQPFASSSRVPSNPAGTRVCSLAPSIDIAPKPNAPGTLPLVASSHSSRGGRKTNSHGYCSNALEGVLKQLGGVNGDRVSELIITRYTLGRWLRPIEGTNIQVEKWQVTSWRASLWHLPLFQVMEVENMTLEIPPWSHRSIWHQDSSGSSHSQPRLDPLYFVPEISGGELHSVFFIA